MTDPAQVEIRRAKESLIELLAEKNRRQAQKYFYTLFPDEDEQQPDGSVLHSRDKYPRHMELFEAGKGFRERCSCWTGCY